MSLKNHLDRTIKFGPVALFSLTKGVPSSITFNLVYVVIGNGKEPPGLHHLEEQLQRLQEAAAVEEEVRLMFGRLETFAAKVKERLHQADFQTRREIIRVLVKRVEVDQQQIRVVFRISPTTLPPSSGSAPQSLQH